MATATYTPPAPFYKLYKDYSQGPYSSPSPPPPIQGPYVLYGANYTTDDVLPGLEEQGVRQLYPKGCSSVVTKRAQHRFQEGAEITQQGITTALVRACSCSCGVAITICQESFQELASPSKFSASAPGQSNTDPYPRTTV